GPAELPLATDLQRDVARLAAADVGERDDGDIAMGEPLHLLQGGLHPGRCLRVDHGSEIVDKPAGRREGAARQLSEREQQEQVHAEGKAILWAARVHRYCGALMLTSRAPRGTDVSDVSPPGH